jgi:hypothetical protein
MESSRKSCQYTQRSGRQLTIYGSASQIISHGCLKLGIVQCFPNTFKPEQIDGSEGKEIIIQSHGSTLTYRGQGFLLNRALPNFYFHITTAYAILRPTGWSWVSGIIWVRSITDGCPHTKSRTPSGRKHQFVLQESRRPISLLNDRLNTCLTPLRICLW